MGRGGERVRSSVPGHSSPSRSPTHRPGPQQLSPVVDHRHQDLHHSWVGLDKAGVVHTAPPSLSPAPHVPHPPSPPPLMMQWRRVLAVGVARGQGGTGGGSGLRQRGSRPAPTGRGGVMRGGEGRVYCLVVSGCTSVMVLLGRLQ